MTVEFTASAYKDYCHWKRTDKKKIEKIHALCRAIAEEPYEGLGKPEPLKYDLQGCWSRRIDRTHRLVYCIHKKNIVILACRYHY